MKPINKHIESIITRKISGQINAQEQEQLEQWLSQDQEHVHYFDELKKTYDLVNTPTNVSIPQIDVAKEWFTFKKAVTPKSNTLSFWKIAASLVLLMVIGYVFYLLTNTQNNITVIAQTQGQQVTLPDNSIITLNKGASLTYPSSFDETKRNVTLRGEAFFEITHNEAKPFKVALPQSSVEVLGTSFNIDASKNNNYIEVIVATGKVKFTNATSNDNVILTKGEKGILTTDTNMLTKSTNSDINYLAWKTRKLLFKNMALDEVIKTINSLYDAKIVFTTDVDHDCKVTVSFENQSLEEVLDVLSYTLQLEYSTHGDLIEITKTGCH